MRSSVALVLGLILGGAGSAVAGSLRPIDTAAGLASQVRDELVPLNDLATRTRDPALRDHLLQAFARIDARMIDIMALAQVQGPGGPQVIVVQPAPQAPPVAQGPVAMSDAEFGGILGAVRGEPFSEGKLNVLRSAARGRYFTVQQVIRVIGELPFSDDQVEAGALLYPVVADPWDWYQVYGALTFDSAKSELRARTEGR